MMQSRRNTDADQPVRRVHEQEPNWMFLTVVVALGLMWLGTLLAPPPKLRSSRISSINSLQTVTLVITNTSTNPPGIPRQWN